MRVLIAAPPGSAVGGVASYTTAVVGAVRGARRFDQWWPLSERSPQAPVRLAVHVAGLVRWTVSLAARRPDVVHLQVTSPGISRDVLYLRIARRLRVPVVAHLHTSDFVGSTATTSARRGLSRVTHGADAVIVMSTGVADEVASTTGAPAGRLRVLPNPLPPLEPPAEPVVRGGTPVLLCVGELCERKGQVELARVVDGLQRRVSLRLAGPVGDLGPDEVDSLEASPSTHLLGVTRGAVLTAAYDAATVFVLFSNSEAEPLALLEAMSRGLPVVATDVGSVRVLLESAGPGNPVVAAGDDVALAEALTKVLDDPAGAAEQGARNQAWVASTRSLQSHVESLEEIYRSVAHGRSARA